MEWGLRRCTPCWNIRNAETRVLERRSEELAGGRTAYRALTPPQRRALRQRAKGEPAKSLGVPALPLAAPRVSTKVYREDNPQGYVYAITNPAWPGMVKLGMTGDLKKRLGGYNTGSPFRDYVLLHHAHTYDKVAAERRIHEMFKGHHVGGEWFRDIPEAQLWDAFAEVYEFDGRAFGVSEGSESGTVP